MQTNCPCNPSKLYSNCCLPMHQGKKIPNTAEQLMRSRYSAYVLNLFDYIHKTWHPSSRSNLGTTVESDIIWIKLIINKAWHHHLNNESFVDFDAFYELNGTLEKMHEISRFVNMDGKWLYIDGKVS